MVKQQGHNNFLFGGKFFFFKDNPLPIFEANLDKIGLLEPSIAKEIVITSSFIKSAINQIDLIGNHNINNQKINIDSAIYDLSLAVISIAEAKKALDYTIIKLEKVINEYSKKLSNPFPNIDNEILIGLGKSVETIPANTIDT